MTLTDLVATGTTWLDADRPSQSFYGRTGYAALHASYPSQQAVTTFAWPFGPDQTDGANVLKATLRLRTRKLTATAARSIRAQLITSPFAIRTVNWSTRPAFAATPMASATKTGAQGENATWELDVTPLMQRAADSGAFYGFLLTTNTSTEAVLVQSSMGASLNPHLVVEWTLAPKPPSSLAPSAGRAVGIPKPTLRWSFFDHAGDSERLASIQVQISKTGSFTAPDWDSGEIETHWCSLDLNETDYPGFGTAVPIYWRVRNRDTAGLWSGWSIPTSWVYRPRPVVTLQNPGAKTTHITDPTPPIDWTYASPTGAAQKAFRVGLYVKDPSGKWGLQEASGTVRSADTKWTPTKPLRWRNGLYKAVVDVFDIHDREATPGDPGYSSDSAEFTFRPDADTTSAYDLRATSGYPLPHVLLTWQHTQQPDEWLIYRDGELLARYPGDRLIQGQTPRYRLVDRWAPNGKHTWQVHAMINGESWPSGIVEADVQHLGTWLVDEETQDAVCIQNDTDHDMAFGEVSSVHEVLGSPTVILVTEALRGYEGTVSGGLYDARGLTYGGAKGWRDNLLKFKSNPGKEYRLLIEDQDLRVQVKDIQVTGDPDRWGEWKASFSFWQTDWFTYDTNVAGEG